MKKLLFSILLILCLPVLAQATIYWVDDDGTKNWDQCVGETPLSGANACTVYKMRAGSTSPGDIVNFRGGNYSISLSALQALIQPKNTGTSESKITYQAYESEKPIFTGGGSSVGDIGVLLSEKDYIVVKGLTFVNYGRWMTIQNGSDHNEISYCEFYNSSGAATQAVLITGWNGSSYTSHSTHNWLHHNIFHDQAGTACYEGGDILKVGSASTGDNGSNNNTIENNIFYHAGHTLTDSFTHYNVWRNNIGRNEGFKDNVTEVTGTATSGSTTTLVDTSKNFVTAGVTIGSEGTKDARYVINTSNGARARVSSITTTTNTNDTLNFSTGTGTPTFTTGTAYSVGCKYGVAAASPCDSKYAHRDFHLDTQDGVVAKYNLFEGNRAGHSAVNPANNGSQGLSLASGNNIVRYNAFYNNAGAGLYFKNNTDSAYNHVYNNTFYANGSYNGLQWPANPLILAGMQFISTTVNNSIKNNLFYGNTSDLSCGGNSCNGVTNVLVNNWCSHSIDGCPSAYRGIDPQFVDPDITDYDSQHLFSGVTGYAATPLPDLTLQSTSPAINSGTYLTQVNDADGCTAASEDCTSLVVDDATYFQDGSWGSDLTRTAGTMLGDEICISASSTVADLTRCKQISAVNVDGVTITLATEMSWANNEYVWLYKKSDGVQVLYGDATDMGAHEYESSDTPPSYTVTVSKTGAGCSLSHDGEYTIYSGDTMNVALTLNNGWKGAWSGTCPATGTDTRVCTPTDNQTMVYACEEIKLNTFCR
jgi:hypothetical protein